MFESLIEQARSIIQRLHESAELGVDKVPESIRVRPSELEAWDVATHGIVALLFGANSAAWVRLRALAELNPCILGRQQGKVGEHCRECRKFTSRRGQHLAHPSEHCGTAVLGDFVLP